MPRFSVLYTDAQRVFLTNGQEQTLDLPLALFDAAPSPGATVLVEVAALSDTTPLPAPLAHAVLNELLRPPTL